MIICSEVMLSDAPLLLHVNALLRECLNSMSTDTEIFLHTICAKQPTNFFLFNKALYLVSIHSNVHIHSCRGI